MPANYGKLDFLQREKVWALAQGGHSGAKISRMMAVGFPRDDPPIERVRITTQAVNDLIRSQRAEWQTIEAMKTATAPVDDQFDSLRSKLMRIANAQATRLADRQRLGKLDADELQKLARAVKALESMQRAAGNGGRAAAAPAKPKVDPGAVPPPITLAETLLRKGDDVDSPSDDERPDSAVPSDVAAVPSVA